MDLILHPDIYIEFFKSFFNVKKSDIQVQINSLLTNENNRFILSKSLIGDIEKYFSTEDLNAIVGPFLSQLINNNTLSIKGEASDDATLITESMIKNYLISDKEKREIFLNICLFEKNSGSKLKPNIVIEKASRPDIEWLLLQLACYNPQTVTLRYFDFKNNAQIMKLFKGLFLNVSPTTDVLIFDRQANLQHPLFNEIENRNLFYYTTMYKSVPDSLDKVNDIKSKFRKVKIFSTHSDQIHERKVFIQNLIIEADDDFWNLEFDRTTWKIDFVYCSSTSKKLKEKITLFKKVRFN